MKRKWLALLPLLLWSPLAGPTADLLVREGPIVEAEITGVISSVTVEYVKDALQEGRNLNAALVIFEMDTPGGLVTSTEEIIQLILASEIPVAIYVAPAGAQAASAGLYITNAADVAAMSPGTRIGAGHPIMTTGENPGGQDNEGERNFLGEKVEHDAAAGVRSIATQRSRNAEVYEKMVRDSISLTEREALDQNVIDLIAKNRDDLIAQLNDREIRRFDGTVETVSLSASRVERHEMSPRQKILAWIANPQISFLLLALGLLGLYIEFNNPGLIAPGVLGGLALVLFAMSAQIIPINLLGVFLIILALVLFVLEINFTSYGFLTLGGIVCLTLGFLTLFDLEKLPAMELPLRFILPTSITIGLIMGAVTAVAIRAQTLQVVTGREGLRGEVGEATTEISGQGKVFVHGEYWDAFAQQPIPRGTRVRVKRVDDLRVEVEPADFQGRNES